MTTIAYRDGVMAGDRRATDGDLAWAEMRKVFRRRDGCLIGGCGNTTILQRYVDWFLDGERGFKPGLGVKDEDAEFLVVRQSGRVEFHDRNGVHGLQGRFFAIGSGSSAALGAMYMGATARQAVKAASRFDVNTGEGMHVVQL